MMRVQTAYDGPARPPAPCRADPRRAGASPRFSSTTFFCDRHPWRSRGAARTEGGACAPSLFPPPLLYLPPLLPPGAAAPPVRLLWAPQQNTRAAFRLAHNTQQLQLQKNGLLPTPFPNNNNAGACSCVPHHSFIEIQTWRVNSPTCVVLMGTMRQRGLMCCCSGALARLGFGRGAARRGRRLANTVVPRAREAKIRSARPRAAQTKPPWRLHNMYCTSRPS